MTYSCPAPEGAVCSVSGYKHAVWTQTATAAAAIILSIDITIIITTTPIIPFISLVPAAEP